MWLYILQAYQWYFCTTLVDHLTNPKVEKPGEISSMKLIETEHWRAQSTIQLYIIISPRAKLRVFEYWTSLNGPFSCNT